MVTFGKIACKVALLALWLPMLMGAEVVYRWIDDNGVVNYTQQAPRGVKSQRITTREGAPSIIADFEEVPTNERFTQPELSDEQQVMLDQLKAAELVRQEEVTKIRQANCKQAREVLSNLSTNSRIRVRNSNGVERVMGEDERQRRIDEAQQGIVVNCIAA